MNESWAAICLGIVCSVFIRMYFKYQNKKKLRPNCLITKYPIVFISERKNLLTNIFSQSQIPNQLFEHGYETLTFHVSNDDEVESFDEIISILKSIETRYGSAHIFASPTLREKIDALCLQDFHSIKNIEDFSEKPLDEYLNRAISLAENDFQCSH
jgi:hypothetical protein